MVIPTLVCLSCGQVYRPVVIPCSEGGIPGCPPQTPAIPSSFHAVFAISANAPNNPAGAMQIDVSGDAIIAETPTSDQSAHNLGDVPTYAAILPNDSRLFVTSAGSLLPGGIDEVSSFAPAGQSTIATGFGQVTGTSLPTGSQPVFVTSTQNNLVYVANFGTNSVSVINTSNILINTAPVGVQPVAMAETPNALKLYVANQGSNTVSSLNTADLSANPVTGFSGINPVWVVARGDSQKIYVLTQGDGQLVTIDEATDTVTSSLAVGAGANFLLYDPHLNRLYVTNPATGMVYVFSDTGGTNAGVPNDTPVQLAAISFASTPTVPGPCPAVSTSAGCLPTSVAALPDGSRFYVASYQIASTCPDALAGVNGACVIAGLTVFDANSFALEYPATPTPEHPTAPTMALLTYPPFAANLTTNQYQYAVPQVTSCATPALYTPAAMRPRFRVFTTAAVDSSHVYVSMCDAEAIAVINTSGSNTNNSGGTPTPADTLITDLPAPFSAASAPQGGSAPLQNPIFMLTGQ
jgi:YVTN family beta-propeller protein